MSKTAGEAGWHKSRYNIGAAVPGKNVFAMVNLLKGTCAGYTPAEMFLYSQVESLDEHHPILEYFARAGLIVNYDELEALKVMGRMSTTAVFSDVFHLTVCPTTGCNFDCPYCFENHNTGIMTEQVQDDVAGLLDRILDIGTVRRLEVSWYGGEPLLGSRVIEALSPRFIDLCEKHGVAYNAEIITNGYLLTQPIADLLGRCRVTLAQITLDGIGPEHDKTRRLAGGGPTFERITGNLRTLKLPFRVSIRHNVHAGNYDQIEPVRALVAEIARESGNRITYSPTAVISNDAADTRGSDIQTLSEKSASDLGILVDAARFTSGRSYYCLANCLNCIGIDEKGRLHRCWENVDKAEQAFGTAARWDPTDIIRTADSPDNLTRYINAAMPMDDRECLDCVWLPCCGGGCPNKRIFYHQKVCLPYKEHPEDYVLALYRLNQEKKMEKPDKASV